MLSRVVPTFFAALFVFAPLAPAQAGTPHSACRVPLGPAQQLAVPGGTRLVSLIEPLGQGRLDKACKGSRPFGAIGRT